MEWHTIKKENKEFAKFYLLNLHNMRGEKNK